jgi:hypothetical protein
MKMSFTLLLAAWFTLSFSQDRYTAGMQKAMDLWSADQPTEAANLFERISKAEPDQWLPPYYVALIYATGAFGEEDEVVLTEGLNKARDFIDIADAISPDNPEILVVRAMINTAWIAFDGRRYGMTLSPANNQLYQRAIELAPNNPRVVFSKADWEMGSARYFGKDTAPYCGAVRRSLKLFEEFSSDTPFYPKWGEPRARQVAAQCE